VSKNLVDLEKGPLRMFELFYIVHSIDMTSADAVCKVLDQAWALVAPIATKYWH
jgi:hypothetical protein